MSKEPRSIMTVQQLFDAVKASPMDVIFSFKEKSTRYQLSAVSVGVLDPIIGKVRGAVIICFKPDEEVREDRFHFKLVQAKVFIWAYKKPLETKARGFVTNMQNNIKKR